MPVVDEGRFQSGYDLAGWIQHGQDEYHRQFTSRIASTVRFRPEDEAFFKGLPGSVKLLVISEACGADSETTGVLSRCVEAAGGRIQVRAFARNDVPDLMQRYLKHGRFASVPVWIALTDDNEEAAVMYELPPAHDAWVQDDRYQYIVVEKGYAEGTNLGDLPESEQMGWIERYRVYRREHEQELNQGMIDEVKRLVTAALEADRVPVRRQAPPESGG